MSIKYDLLKQQIGAVSDVIDDEVEQEPTEYRQQRLELLRGVKTLLEYIHEEEDGSNLNVWEDEADHAANEVNG